MQSIRVILLGSGKATNCFLKKCKNLPYISIVGNVPDHSVNATDLRGLNNEIRDMEIDIFELNEDVISKSDIVFSIEYRRIVPSELCDKFLFVNCHGGILPKWRGFSANAWAIMNGESEIGFSIHRVREGLDAGEIYYVKHMPIAENQTYGDLHADMIDAIVNETPQLLFDIVNGKISGEKQPDCGFVYCNRFTASMGNIGGFVERTDYYVNLYRCMAKPLGTGVWFVYKDKKYTVNKIEPGRQYGVADYLGIPGKVVNTSDGKLWIKTQDNVVVLSSIEVDGNYVDVGNVFTNGNRIV